MRPEERQETEERRAAEAGAGPPPEARVRDRDLQPHDGLRYIARLFKILAVLLILLLVAEIAIGLIQEGSGAVAPLLVEATRLIVFAGLLWGAGDLAILLIESNHDLRATRILAGRITARLDALLARLDADPGADEPHLPPPESRRP